ncbi:hypothetical protein DFJ77DRAFT_442179 [Powellomyces hirtus]|nr:hypothetical protein DFJ77DRAFT_442179 [Powellomyces hirtus]
MSQKMFCLFWAPYLQAARSCSGRASGKKGGHGASRSLWAFFAAPVLHSYPTQGTLIKTTYDPSAKDGLYFPAESKLSRYCNGITATQLIHFLVIAPRELGNATRAQLFLGARQNEYRYSCTYAQRGIMRPAKRVFHDCGNAGAARDKR